MDEGCKLMCVFLFGGGMGMMGKLYISLSEILLLVIKLIIY